MVNIHYLILTSLICLLGFFIYKKKIKVKVALLVLFVWLIIAHNELIKIKFYVEFTVYQKYTTSVLVVNEHDKKEAKKEHKTREQMVNEFHNYLLIDRYFRVDKGDFDLLEVSPYKKERVDNLGIKVPKNKEKDKSKTKSKEDKKKKEIKKEPKKQIKINEPVLTL